MFVFLFFWCCDFAFWTLIGSRPDEDVDERWFFACLAWFYELFVGMLILLTNAYAGCGRPTLNFIERIDLGRSVPTAKPLHLMSVGRNVQYVQNVD